MKEISTSISDPFRGETIGDLLSEIGESQIIMTVSDKSVKLRFLKWDDELSFTFSDKMLFMSFTSSEDALYFVIKQGEKETKI